MRNPFSYNSFYLLVVRKITNTVTKITIFPRRKIGNISFAICTWPNSSVRAKILSKFQFEGKNHVWINFRILTRICTLWEGCCFHPLFYNTGLVKVSLPALISTLVTQPMMQRRPNCTELRSMDSYIQILCRFQKSKQKVPPPSLPCTKKSLFTTPKDEKKISFFWEGGVKGDFLV